MTYYKKQLVETIVESDSGVLDQDKEEVLLSNNVKIKSTNGKKILTNEIKWIKSKKKFFCNKKVQLLFKDSHTIFGSSLVADTSLNTISLNQGVGVLNEKK